MTVDDGFELAAYPSLEARTRTLAEERKARRTTMQQARVEQIVREYRQGLEALFGNQLAGVMLYGSFARREGRDDSDIDVLCILRGPFDYRDALRTTSELTASLSLAHGVVLSRVFVSEADLETRNLPFFMNVRRDGVPA